MLHGKPQCAASRMALHLEQTYGLQLDPYRHRQLVAELEEYAGRVDEAESGESCEASEALFKMPFGSSPHPISDQPFRLPFEFTRPSAEAMEQAYRAINAIPDRLRNHAGVVAEPMKVTPLAEILAEAGPAPSDPATDEAVQKKALADYLAKNNITPLSATGFAGLVRAIEAERKPVDTPPARNDDADGLGAGSEAVTRLKESTDAP